MDAQGTVLIPLDEEQVPSGGAQRGGAGRAGDRHPVPAFVPQPGPRAAREGDRREANFPQLFVTASHELSQEYREYERTSTAAANAYIGPRVQRYLTEMEAHLDDAGFGGNFLIVQSTGGLFDVERRAGNPASACWNPAPPPASIGTKALCDSISIANAIAFDMGGTTAKAGVIYRGQRADDRRGADRRLCHRPADADADDRHPGGRHRRRQHRPRRGRQRLARRPGKRRRRARAGLLRPRRHRADHHRRQPGARPARRRPLPRRRDAARSRRGEEGAHRQDRQAARPRSGRSGRRHPPHRHDQDGACGALGDHRARPRRRRLRARRLRRRRAAARLGGGARARRSARSSSRARRGISRPTACWSPTCAAISSTPGSRRSPTRRSPRWRRSSPRWSGRAARPSARGQTLAGVEVRRSRRHALRRPGARRHRRSADRAVHERRTATASRAASMPCTRRATASRSPTEKAEIVSLRGAVIGEMRKPPFEPIAKGGAEPDAAAFRGKRPVYFASDRLRRDADL